MDKSAYYNDNEPYVIEWLGNLAREGLVTNGKIDGRPIQEIKADDLRGFRRCHFFAGIGGWDYALQLAGWPADRPVWTGSCPCQPFSQAGRRKGVEDDRHLWPVWQPLIADCHPPTIFGEQVASKDGRLWLDRVRADLEKMGYAVGAADLCAASVNAPHMRHRLWWVAHRVKPRLEGHSRDEHDGDQSRRLQEDKVGSVAESDISGGLADAENPDRRGAGREGNAGRRTEEIGGSMPFNGVDNTMPRRHGIKKEKICARGKPVIVSNKFGGMVDPDSPRPQPRREGAQGPRHGGALEPTNGSMWDDFDIAWRRNPSGGDPVPSRIEPRTFPMDAGVPARVGKLRAYGNTIVPQVAAEFIMAYLELHGSY